MPANPLKPFVLPSFAFVRECQSSFELSIASQGKRIWPRDIRYMKKRRKEAFPRAQSFIRERKGSFSGLETKKGAREERKKVLLLQLQLDVSRVGPSTYKRSEAEE